MARSAYVYVVRQYDGHTEVPVIAAFTVKHELVSYLEKMDTFGVEVEEVRCRDQRVTQLCLEDLT